MLADRTQLLGAFECLALVVGGDLAPNVKAIMMLVNGCTHEEFCVWSNGAGSAPSACSHVCSVCSFVAVICNHPLLFYTLLLPFVCVYPLSYCVAFVGLKHCAEFTSMNLLLKIGERRNKEQMEMQLPRDQPRTAHFLFSAPHNRVH